MRWGDKAAKVWRTLFIAAGVVAMVLSAVATARWD